MSEPTIVTRQCIAEAFLANVSNGSNKGYVARVFARSVFDFEFYTNHGPRSSGMNRNQKPPVIFGSERLARQAFDRKVQAELSKGYQVCTPSFIGLTRLLNDNLITTNAPSGSGVAMSPTPYLVWSPSLYSTADEGTVERAIEDPSMILQRKYDGERMRIGVSENRSVFSCNRRGMRTDMGPELLRSAQTLINSLNTSGWNEPNRFDFDGERIGSSSYVIWDNVFPDPEAPYDERFKSILLMARDSKLPQGFQVAQTAFKSETKRAMFQAAKDNGWEGVMVKRRTAPYSPGRSVLDLKYPFSAVVTVRITGVHATSTTQFGSVSFEIRTSGSGVVQGGRVSSGFVAGQIEKIAQDLTQGQTIFADIRYKNWTGAALFQPRFERFRTDLTWDDCVVTSLRGASVSLLRV